MRLQARIGGGLQGEVFRAESAAGELAVKAYNPPWATPAQARAIDRLDRPRFSRSAVPLAGRATGLPPAVTAGDLRLRHAALRARLLPARAPGERHAVVRARAVDGPDHSDLPEHAVESFRLLHLSGLCYRDVSLANVFFDPRTANIRICDVDNVGIDDGSSKVLGTPLFMAPEIVRDTAFRTFPSRSTDLHSLAVLLFFLLFMEHPLIGRKVDRGLWDEQHALIHFGREPVFVLCPGRLLELADEPARRALLGAVPAVPSRSHAQRLRRRVAPPSARVTEGEWRVPRPVAGLHGQRPHCGSTVFHDLDTGTPVLALSRCQPVAAAAGARYRPAPAGRVAASALRRRGHLAVSVAGPADRRGRRDRPARPVRAEEPHRGPVGGDHAGR